MYSSLGEYLRSLFSWLITAISSYVCRIARPYIKWILRKSTGLCELQRTCYCEPAGAKRTLAIEHSLRRSNNEQVKKLLEFLDRAATEQRFSDPTSPVVSNTVKAICDIKKIRLEVHQPFGKSFADCVSIIWGLNELMHTVEDLRKTAYNAEDATHEEKLLELWQLLMPDRQLDARVSNSWKDLGFQGDDPKTDFRGMGLLGLENLLYFSKNYSSAALHVLSHANHPSHGYSFAIVGINLTHLTYTLWKDGAAKSHIYNLCGVQLSKPCRPTLIHFHRFYCYLFFEFDRLWMQEKPANIMEFSRIRDLFERNVRSQLAAPDCLFKLNFPVVHI